MPRFPFTPSLAVCDDGETLYLVIPEASVVELDQDIVSVRLRGATVTIERRDPELPEAA